MILEVISGPDKGMKLKLSPGVILLGRECPDCQLCLSDRKVSRRHATITISKDLDITLVDENSTNGLYARGKRILGSTMIYPGDVISLGDSEIRLIDQAAIAQNKTFDETQVDLLSPKMTHQLSGGSEYVPIGTYTRALQVDSKLISIGRDPSNDFVLDHPTVSRHHARIVSKEGKHIIYDLNSSNGTFVNGNRVINSLDLLPNSLIQISSYRYYFDGHTLLEYDEGSGQVRIEVQSLSKNVTLEKGISRSLLEDINFCIEPREFVAVLGGSGAGKSTLLGALNGLRPATSGEILVNGRGLYKEYDVFRSMIGYVPQDDIVHLDLTVKEVLTYSAQLRMPDDTRPEEIDKTVSQVMADLELASRRDTLVKNLSGGQRKRVSIGVELLTKPGLLFLDEPTSGLDPGLEKMMMEMLRKLADQGRTIILVTHATFNIGLCDKIIFLTEGGKLAFFGTPAEALSYFKAADFAEIYKMVAIEKTPDEWAQDYKNSQYYKSYIGKHQINLQQNNKEPVHTPPSKMVKTSWLKQWLILTRRYSRILTRDRRNLVLLFLQPIVIAMLLVMIFLHSAPIFKYSDYTVEDLIVTEQVIAAGQALEVEGMLQAESNRRFYMSICVALMVFTAIWLGTSNAAREITKEIPIYKRERLINLRINSYLLSKVTVLSVVCVVQTILFVTIISIGLGLPEFWLNVSAFLLISLASLMMGLTVSAIASNADRAISSVPLLLIPQIILSGAIVPAHKVEPEFLQLIFYMAISKWGYELVGGAITDINSRVALETKLLALTGEFANHWWILVGFTIGLYILAMMTLMKKDKQRYSS